MNTKLAKNQLVDDKETPITSINMVLVATHGNKNENKCLRNESHSKSKCCRLQWKNVKTKKVICEDYSTIISKQTTKGSIG